MKVLIEGVAPHVDRTYDLDISTFTNRELHQIKVVSGVRPPEIPEALIYSDAAFASVVATIACQRAGVRVNEDIFLDANGGTIKFFWEEEKTDDPPTAPGKPGTKRKRSGRRSPTSSASPEATQPLSGEQT